MEVIEMKITLILMLMINQKMNRYHRIINSIKDHHYNHLILKVHECLAKTTSKQMMYKYTTLIPIYMHFLEYFPQNQMNQKKSIPDLQKMSSQILKYQIMKTNMYFNDLKTLQVLQKEHIKFLSIFQQTRIKNKNQV